MAKRIRTCARRFTISALGVMASASSVGAKCTLGQIAALPVTMVDMKPMVMAKINGADAAFAADSGAFFSMITPASAAQYKLKTYAAPWGLVVNGLGGAANVSAAMVKEFTLAGVPITNIEFLVGGGEAGGGSAGLLGQNVFRIGDVEYDLGHGMIRLIREDGCSSANLAYWVTADAPQAVSSIDIQSTTALAPHTTATAYVNGAKVRVMFDTGAYASSLSVRAASRAGIPVDASGVIYAGYSRGIGPEQVKTWIAPVASFKLGDEEIKNTRLRISESTPGSADMLLGADFFLSHRVFVSTRQNKLFFTYNGGRVFNLAASAQTSGSAQAAGPIPMAPSDEPKDAAEFGRRGSAYAARRDFTQALADLTRACELAPEEPDYLYERGLVHQQKQEATLALADFDAALKLKSDHVPALMARAELLIAGKQVERGVDDLNAADRAASREADVRLQMAAVYARANLLPQALNQLNAWIVSHGADSRMVQASIERCQIRAELGQELDKALEDCDTAFKRSDKKDPRRMAALRFRALVRLRLGDNDKAISDYDTVLRDRPQDTWALYGRGIAKLRRGNLAGGRADMSAATTLSPRIADTFTKIGIADTLPPRQ